MKYTQILIIMISLFISEQGNSQSLNVDQTIQYINNFFKKHTFHQGDSPVNKNDVQLYKSLSGGKSPFTNTNSIWGEVALDKDGKFTQKYIEKNNQGIIRIYGSIESFNINDIGQSQYDDNPLRELKVKDNRIFLSCSEKMSCFKSELSYSTPSYKTYILLLVPFVEIEGYEMQKLVNAYKYLFSLALETGQFSRKDEDPFASKNFSTEFIRKPIRVASTDPSKSIIKLGVENNVYSVYAKIGSKNHKFIFDSGAGEVAINESLEKQLISEGVISKSDYIDNGLFMIADGSIIECRRLLLKSVTVGIYTVYSVQACVLTGNSDMLLGKSFLDQFRSWSVNNETNSLKLVK